MKGQLKAGTRAAVAKRAAVLAALLSRGVKFKEGTFPEYHTTAPEGFNDPGVFYETPEGKLIRLGKSFEDALEVAKTGSKAWGGIVGTKADATPRGAGATAPRTTSDYLLDFVNALVVPVVVDTTIQSVELRGHEKTATGLRVVKGLVGLGLMTADNPHVRDAGLVAVATEVSRASQQHAAPFAESLFPRFGASKQKQAAIEQQKADLAALDASRPRSIQAATPASLPADNASTHPIGIPAIPSTRTTRTTLLESMESAIEIDPDEMESVPVEYANGRAPTAPT